jgi:uncharacterized protein YndB with AHSA1/START domain
MRIEHEVSIARPRDEVFAYLSDPAHLPEWQAGIVEVVKEGERRFREVRSVLGKRVASEVEVTALEAPERFDLAVVSGPVKVRISHRLEAADGGTQLRVAGEADAGVAGLFVGRRIEKQVERDFAKLKELLEGRS